MDVSDVISQMRDFVKVDISQYPDTSTLRDLNTLKDSFWSYIITKSRSKVNWETWTTSSIALQSEYTLASVASNAAGTKQLSGVAVCYNGETYDETGLLKYIPAKQVNLDSLEKDWNYYVENQDEDKPIFYKADNSYFIAPAPRTAITNGIKLIGIRKIPDYTLSTTEAEMKLPIDQIQSLVFGLAVYGNIIKGNDLVTVREARQVWKEEREEAVNMINSVVEENPFTNEYPE